MNTQQLLCFICVAEKLNFTKAAEELYLSTPTVTHHIKKLEEELGAKLFIRTSKMVRLTEAGGTFYSDAKDILMKMEISQKRAQRIAVQALSFIRIGCSSYAELELLSPVLSDLQQDYPQVHPQIFLEDYFYLQNLFYNDQVDVLFATKDMIKGVDDCIFKKIKDAPLCAVLPDGSPLSQCQSLTFDDLKESCLINVFPKFIPFFQYNYPLQERMEMHSQTSLHMVCENDQVGILLAQSGYGVAIMPEFCIPWDVKGVAVVPIAEKREDMEYGLAYKKKSKEKYIRYFVEKFLQMHSANRARG